HCAAAVAALVGHAAPRLLRAGAAMTGKAERQTPALRSVWLNLRLGGFHWAHNHLTDVNLKARHSCRLCRAFRGSKSGKPQDRGTALHDDWPFAKDEQLIVGARTLEVIAALRGHRSQSMSLRAICKWLGATHQIEMTPKGLHRLLMASSSGMFVGD